MQATGDERISRENERTKFHILRLTKHWSVEVGEGDAWAERKSRENGQRSESGFSYGESGTVLDDRANEAQIQLRCGLLSD